MRATSASRVEKCAMAARSVSAFPVRDCQATLGAGHRCRRCSDPASLVPQRGQGLKGIDPHAAPSRPRLVARAV
eukprot:7489028-Lingulodinium_polyedra.AAC.1